MQGSFKCPIMLQMPSPESCPARTDGKTGHSWVFKSPLGTFLPEGACKRCGVKTAQPSVIDFDGPVWISNRIKQKVKREKQEREARFFEESSSLAVDGINSEEGVV